MIGTEIIRNQIDPNYWVKYVINTIEELSVQKSHWNGNSCPETLIIIGDLRFNNEAFILRHFFKDTSYINYKIVRKDSDLNGSDLKGSDLTDTTHESEQMMIDSKLINIVIENDGDMDKLEENIMSTFNVNDNLGTHDCLLI